MTDIRDTSSETYDVVRRFMPLLRGSLIRLSATEVTRRQAESYESVYKVLTELRCRGAGDELMLGAVFGFVDAALAYTAVMAGASGNFEDNYSYFRELIIKRMDIYHDNEVSARSAGNAARA